jgi:hypothetical protein
MAKSALNLTKSNIGIFYKISSNLQNNWLAKKLKHLSETKYPIKKEPLTALITELTDIEYLFYTSPISIHVKV